jgi:hypothetical protein
MLPVRPALSIEVSVGGQMTVRTYTFAERPELATVSQQVMAAGWPAFVMASPVAARHWPRVLAEFPGYQIV